MHLTVKKFSTGLASERLSHIKNITNKKKKNSFKLVSGVFMRNGKLAQWIMSGVR